MARYRHERWDGRGGTEGLAAEAIPATFFSWNVPTVRRDDYSVHLTSGAKLSPKSSPTSA